MLDVALKMVAETPRTDRFKGQAAQFISLGNGWGLKFYDTKCECETTYETQETAFAAGIGPALGEKTTFSVDGMIRYGYITQHAETFRDKFAKKHNLTGNAFTAIEKIEDAERREEVRRECMKIRTTMDNLPEYSDLMYEMTRLGLCTNDMHWGNVGYLPNGKLVCIDFDRC